MSDAEQSAPVISDVQASSGSEVACPACGLESREAGPRADLHVLGIQPVPKEASKRTTPAFAKRVEISKTQEQTPSDHRSPLTDHAKAALNPSQGVKDFASLLKPVPTKEVLSKMARTDLEIERIKDQAYRAAAAEGYRDGFAKGKEEGFPNGRELGREQGFEEAARLKQEELDAFHDELVRTVGKVHEAIQEWFKNSEPGIAQLATTIAQRIVAKELTTDPKTILAMTIEAISEVTHATHARIKVRPFDSEILEANKSEILAAAHSVRDLEIVEDENLIGGCVIETDGGVVDATIDQKFREMLDQIRRAA